MYVDKDLEVQVKIKSWRWGSSQERETSLVEALSDWRISIETGTFYVESIVGLDGKVWFDAEKVDTAQEQKEN